MPLDDSNRLFPPGSGGGGKHDPEKLEAFVKKYLSDLGPAAVNEGLCPYCVTAFLPAHIALLFLEAPPPGKTPGYAAHIAKLVMAAWGAVLVKYGDTNAKN